MSFVRCLMALVAGLFGLVVRAVTIDAVKVGADPSGKTLCTAQLQSAIDQTAAAGGGEVVVRSGVYLVTALTLKSGVTLRLDGGAVLRPSRASADYGTDKLPVVGAECATGIAVIGKGVIEGAVTVFTMRMARL